MRRNQHAAHGATTAAHVMRSGDHGGSGANPSLHEDGKE